MQLSLWDEPNAQVSHVRKLPPSRETTGLTRGLLDVVALLLLFATVPHLRPGDKGKVAGDSSEGGARPPLRRTA